MIPEVELIFGPPKKGLKIAGLRETKCSMRPENKALFFWGVTLGGVNG